MAQFRYVDIAAESTKRITSVEVSKKWLLIVVMSSTFKHSNNDDDDDSDVFFVNEWAIELMLHVGVICFYPFIIIYYLFIIVVL